MTTAARKTLFAPLFEIRIRHGYYTGGRCRDFSFEATAATSRILANYRLTLKSYPDGIGVFATVVSGADGDQPIIALAEDLELRFRLRVANPDFPLFTDLGEHDRLEAPEYTNAGTGGRLDLQSGAEAPPPGVFAEVAIRDLDAGWLRGGKVSFTISFEPKQARWAYYFVSDRLEGNREPSIADNDPGRGDAPIEFRSEELSETHRGDSVAEELAARYPDHSRYRLLSEEPLACREAARKNLALYVGNQELYSTVANPRLSDYATITVSDGGDLREQDSLFRVIKH